jgi:HAD superfamily phosphatase (TIGR01681 family)
MKIVVFDFDKTLTVAHTGGNPIKGVDYFSGHLPLITKYLKTYRQHGWKIYVNTRGIQSIVISYLRSVSLFKYINGVYGALTIEELGRNDWAKRKVRILHTIRQLHDEVPDNIYFFDDTKENILAAKQAGYANSYVVTNTTGIPVPGVVFKEK